MAATEGFAQLFSDESSIMAPMFLKLDEWDRLIRWSRRGYESHLSLADREQLRLTYDRIKQSHIDLYAEQHAHYGNPSVLKEEDYNDHLLSEYNELRHSFDWWVTYGRWICAAPLLTKTVAFWSAEEYAQFLSEAHSTLQHWSRIYYDNGMTIDVAPQLLPHLDDLLTLVLAKSLYSRKLERPERLQLLALFLLFLLGRDLSAEQFQRRRSTHLFTWLQPLDIETLFFDYHWKSEEEFVSEIEFDRRLLPLLEDRLAELQKRV